jgi:hypothetical protein
MIADSRFWYGVVLGAVALLLAQHFLLSKGAKSPALPSYNSQQKNR